MELIQFNQETTYSRFQHIIWKCVGDNIIAEGDKYKEIGLHGYYYKLFEEEEDEGTRNGI